MQVHKLNYTAANGGTPINFLDWIATLPEDQQIAFAAAREKQDAIDAANIAAGHLVGHEDGVVNWADNVSQEIINNIDSDWKTFFERYLAENQITLTVDEIQA